MEKGIASLNYLSLAIGFVIGLQISHPLMDKVRSISTWAFFFQALLTAIEAIRSLQSHLWSKRRRP